MPAGFARILAPLIGVCFAGAAVSAPSPDPRWTVFSNPETGIRVEYPAGVFSLAYGDPPRGVGQAFRTEDGRAQLLIYTVSNEARETPARYLRNNLKVAFSALYYRRVTDRFFAVSGVHGDAIYYSRCNFLRTPTRAILCVELTYPQREKRAWDGIVTRVSLSLRRRGPSQRHPGSD